MNLLDLQWAVLAVASTVLLWLGVLTAAWVAQRRQQQRLSRRVVQLQGEMKKATRMRHTSPGMPRVGPPPVPSSTRMPVVRAVLSDPPTNLIPVVRPEQLDPPTDPVGRGRHSRP